MQSGDVVNGEGDGDPGYEFPDETFKVWRILNSLLNC